MLLLATTVYEFAGGLSKRGISPVEAEGECVPEPTTEQRILEEIVDTGSGDVNGSVYRLREFTMAAS
jgi:hypothetical protein